MNISRKKIFYLLGTLPVAGALIIFLLNPQRYAACVSEGISLWALSVLPSVFPFLFLTSVLRKTRAFNAFSRRTAPFFSRVFKISGTGGGIFILSVLSGYPVGARTVSDCYRAGALDRSELFRLSCLCSTTGPVFLVGVVGGAMFLNIAAGWILLLCHVLAVIAVCAVLALAAPKFKPNPLPRASADKSDGGIYASIVSALCVGGTIALFSCFSQMVADLLRLPAEGALTALVRGLMEMTTGCALFARIPARFSLCAVGFLTTFGGACVLFQQLAFLKPAGVKALPFVLVKFIQGLVCALLAFAFSFVLC